MNRVDEYNLFVLCSGLAGKLVAWTLVKEGKRATVLDRKLISGSCPKEGACRARMLDAAKVPTLFQRHQEFAIQSEPIDMSQTRL